MGRPDFIDPGKEKLYGSALGFISRWNDKGIPKDERALQLILHADALIGILNDAEGAETLLRSAGRDPDSVKADIRAAFKTMHLNNRMDHYATLLLFPNAAPAVIKARFKTLMLFYHPDRQIDRSPDDPMVAKRITEAYNALKDSSRKEAYERNLVHRAFSITRAYGEKHMHRDPRYLITRVIIPSAAVFCLLLAGAFFLTGEDKEKYVLETALSTKSGAVTGPREADSRQGAGPVTDLTAAPDKQAVAPAKAATGPLVTPGEKKVRAGILTPPWATAKPKSEPPSEVRTALMAPLAAPVRSAPPAPPATPEKAPPVQAVPDKPPPHDYEKDAAAFVKQYAAAYEEGDLKRFINFYSLSVVENGKLGYDGVKKAYAQNFENNRYKYDLKNMRFEHKGEYLSVSGTYRITKLRGADRRPTQGEIIWILKQEDGNLRIVRVESTKTSDEAKAPPVQAAPEKPSAPDHERDAAAFVKQYATAYEEGDLKRFINFYSPSVVENGRFGYDAIKKAYARNFEINRYKYDLLNMRSEHKGEYLRISGTYHLTKLRGSDRRPIQGEILWTLKREEGDLKIVRVDYKRF